jgi:hypothetical protein
MARSPDDVPYFQEMCQQTMQSIGLHCGPWRQDRRGNCNFLFRLAYEIRTNLSGNLKTLSNAVRVQIESGFLTTADLKDFTMKLTVRIDRGMLMEDAVSIWIDENLDPGSCVIS